MSAPLLASTFAKEHNPHILGVGSACMDLLLPVEETFLKHLKGQKGGAAPISFEHLTHVLNQSLLPPFMCAGGSCANTLKGLAALDQQCLLITSIGCDEIGKQLENALREKKLDLLLHRSTLPTMRVLCLVTPDGERTMRFFSGCHADLPTEYAQPLYFKSATLVHLNAYDISHKGWLTQIVRLAKAEGAVVSIDLSSFEIAQRYSKELTHLIALGIDIVFGNQSEITALTQLPLQEGCLRLNQCCPIIVGLMGAKGCFVMHEGKGQHYAGFTAQLVDTTGAGDLFASGFLHGYLQGEDLATCATWGNYLGSAMVEVVGTELSSAKWQEIKCFMGTFEAK